MASGSFNGYIIKDSAYKIVVNWNDDTYSVPNNSSTPTVTVNLVQGSGWGLHIGSRDITVTINGKDYKRTAPAINNDGSRTTQLCSVTGDAITHNPDGTKSISIKVVYAIQFTRSSTGTYYASISASKTVDLRIIPRASEIAAATSNIIVDGINASSVSINRKANIFYHKVTWSIANKSYTESGVSTSAQYVIPQDWLEAMPNTAQGTATVTVTTYNNQECTGTAVGAASVTFTMIASDDMKPQIEDGWITFSPVQPTAIQSWTNYISDYSAISVVFDSNKEDTSAIYGATIANRSIVFAGREIKTTGTSLVTDTITVYGNDMPIEFRLYDSRGRYVSYETTISVYAYTNPVMTNIRIYRSNSQGEETDEGEAIYVNVKADIAPCGGDNSIATFRVGYGTINGSVGNWQNIVSETASVLWAGAISSSSSWQIRVELVDAMGTSATFDAIITTAHVAHNIRDGGNGAAYGKYAEEEDTFDIAWHNLKLGGMMVINDESFINFITALSEAADMFDINLAASEFLNDLTEGS